MAGRKGRSGGRNAKSDEQLRHEGTYRKDRHGRKRPPAPEVGMPSPPVRLEGAALVEWKRMLALLQPAKLLSVVDGAMLYNYCELHSDAVAMRAHLRLLERRARQALDSGERACLEKQQGKLWGQMRAYRQAIRMFLVEFGLSPSARSRVDVDGGGDGQEIRDGLSFLDDPPKPLECIRQQARKSRR